MTKKEMRERQRVLVEEARAKLAEIETAKDEARAAEIEVEYDAIMAEHDALDGKIEKLETSEARQARLAELEGRGDSRRPRGSDARSDDHQDGEGGEEEGPTYESAFRSYLQRGLGDLAREERSLIRERRAQSVGTDSEGGFLVPPGFLAELIRSMAAYSPMFDEAVTRQIVTATGNGLEIPTENDTANKAVLIAENTAAADTDLAFGQIMMEAYKYTSGIIKVSAELMQDSAIDPEAEVRNAMATRFARGIGEALTIGDGTAKPHGIAVAAGAGITAAAAAAVTFDELIDLQHSVDPAYRMGAQVGWMFHDTTLKVLRKVKDADGNFIWQPANAQTGAPALLLSHGYRINQAMPTMAASARSILFGDMGKYAVRRVREVGIRRLDERFAESDQIGFVGFARVDGEILDPAAIKALKQAA